MAQFVDRSDRMQASRRSFIGFFAALVFAIALALPSRARAAGPLTFELYEDQASAYRWRLDDGGQILATAGQGYRAKSEAKASIERIRNELGRLTFETYEDAAHRFRWRLKSRNGQVVASSSRGYDAKADVDAAVERIRTGAKDARVVDRATRR